MSSKNSLYITKEVLEHASGLDVAEMKKDIESGKLILDKNGMVWYRTASQYVMDKWSEGKAKMYDPNGGEPDHNFSSRVLSILDDEIAVSNLIFTWEK